MNKKTMTGNTVYRFPSGTKKITTPEGRRIFQKPAKETAKGTRRDRYTY